MPYEDKIMVASGDSEHPGEEEVGFETIPRRGGEGHTYDIKFTNNSEDLTLTEDETDKTSLHLWTTIKEKIKSILHITNNTIDDITDVYGAKNLLPVQTSYTAGGDASIMVDPVLNSDGTVEFGEFSGGTNYTCTFNTRLSLPKTGNYIFTSGLSDASDSTAYIDVYTSESQSVRVYNDPVTLSNIGYIHSIVLVSKDGQSRTFKPMIRLEGIESNTYVPHAMTNKQLTDLVITKEILHPVGTVIHSTTCDTMAKVIAAYGGTTWIQLSGYMLRGATSGVTANSNAKDGGSDTVTLTGAQSGLKGHGHEFTQPTVNGGAATTGNDNTDHSHVTNITNGANNSGYGMLCGQTDGNLVWYGTSGAKWGSGNATGNRVKKTFDIGTGGSSGGRSAYHQHSQVAHTHTVSGGAVKNASASNATSSHSVLPNYKNVYIWERTV